MTSYVKATNFAAKDSLPSGNPSKIVKGTEIDTEFNAIATAVNSKLDSSGAATIPTGTLLDFAGGAAPAGYLLCDGSAYSRVTYASLYAVIGNTWGAGDGSTTFNVPDLRRRTTVGAGGTASAGPGNSVGNTGGTETKTLSVAELPAHNHGVNDPGHTHANSLSQSSHAHNVPGTGGGGGSAGVQGNTGGGAIGGTTTDYQLIPISINNAGATTGVTTQNTGSGTAISLFQPSAVVTKIIKT